MKKFLSIVGGLFLLLLIVGGGFVGYTAYKKQGLDASSKAYVERNVPTVVSTWSKDELLKRSSPQLTKILNEKPEQLHLLFQKLSKLGAMQSFGEVDGASSIFYTTQNGKVVSAAYVAKAKFEHGEADVSVKLIQLSGQWQFLSFYVNSPIFLQ